MIRRRVTVLGATGSVGCSTLDLMDQAETAGTGAFEVEALTGGANIARLAEQARRWKPKLAVTADPARLDELRAALAGTGVEAAAGDQAVIEAAARPVDWIMAAIVEQRACARPGRPRRPARPWPWPTRKVWSAAAQR